FGAFALVLELVILVLALELAALLFWIVGFVSFIDVYSYPYLKTLFTRAVGGVVQAFKKLRDTSSLLKRLALSFTFPVRTKGRALHIYTIPYNRETFTRVSAHFIAFIFSYVVALSKWKNFGQSRGMNHQASLPVSDPPRSEPISKERSTKAVHKYIFFLISMLGVLLQLKQGARMTSLFDTNYATIVILIVALTLYGGSLIGSTYIHQARLNSDLEKFMTKISLLFGTLALVLELVILVPNLGLAALLLWIVCFISFVALYTWLYVKILYKFAFAGVVYGFKKLKEYVNMIIAHFTVEAEEQSGLS
ncbi:unnamed protein product, partial [Prunus brigantina]